MHLKNFHLTDDVNWTPGKYFNDLFERTLDFVVPIGYNARENIFCKPVATYFRPQCSWLVWYWTAHNSNYLIWGSVEVMLHICVIKRSCHPSYWRKYAQQILPIFIIRPKGTQQSCHWPTSVDTFKPGTKCWIFCRRSSFLYAPKQNLLIVIQIALLSVRFWLIKNRLWLRWLENERTTSLNRNQLWPCIQ